MATWLTALGLVVAAISLADHFLRRWRDRRAQSKHWEQLGDAMKESGQMRLAEHQRRGIGHSHDDCPWCT